MKKIFLKHLPLMVALMLTLSVTVGTTVASFTDGEEKVNTFSVRLGGIKLTEPLYDELTDEEKVLYPGKEIPKNPIVTNTGSVALYTYVAVSVPSATVRTVGSDNVTISEPVHQKLFSYEANENFAVVYETEEYIVYGYTPSALSPGAKTEALFESIKFLNVLEGDIPEGTELDVIVKAVGIQEDFVSADGETFKEVLANVFLTHSDELLLALNEA